VDADARTLVLAAARRIEAALGGWRAARRPGTG
jgi:hypothetical protein